MPPTDVQLQETASYWAVTEQLGFLPAAAQEVHSLSDGGFADLAAAERLAKDLPLIDDAELLSRLSALGKPAVEDLRGLTSGQAEAAIRAYAFIASRLVHRGQLGPGRTLDSRVAGPLWWLAHRIGRAPSLTYATYVLANWQNSVRRRTPPEEFNIQATFTGTPDEAWFVAVHLSVESVGGEIVEGLARCERGLLDDSVEDVVAGLAIIESALRWSASVFPRIEERLAVGVFTEQVREFLFGYPEVRFAGVAGSPAVSYIGETGAQSGAIRAADAGLGIAHSPDVLESMAQFLSYAPVPHRSYLETAAALGARLTRCLGENRGDGQLRRAYQDARAALGDFRGTHLAVVKRYLVGARSPYPEHGTGGTRYQQWLRQLVNDSATREGG